MSFTTDSNMRKGTAIPKEISVSTSQSVASRDFNDEFTIIAIEDCMTVPSMTSKLSKQLGKKWPHRGKTTTGPVSVISEEVTTESKHRCTRMQCPLVVLSVLLSILSVATLVWLGVTVAKNGQAATASTDANSTYGGSFSTGGIYSDVNNPRQPTTSGASNSRYTQMYNRVRGISGDTALQENSGTPQRQALQWLVSGDPTGVSPDDKTFMLRYALTVIYYAFQGENWYTNEAWLVNANLCAWIGVNCSVRTSSDSNGQVVSKYEITGLSLGNMNLAGSIPTELSYISSLIDIDFSQNRITGTVPTSIGSVVNLESLNLSKNNIEGSIPVTFSVLTELQVLRLNDNMLTGGVLKALANADRLRILHLEHNNLSGVIPSVACSNVTSSTDFVIGCGVTCSCCNMVCT